MTPKQILKWAGQAVAAVVLIALAAVLLFVLSSLASTPAHGQVTSNVNLVPDCLLVFNFSAAGNSVSFDNRQRGCTTWTVTYMAYTFAAVTLTTQSSADNAGAPALWGAFAGTVLSGVNPNVSTAQATTNFQGYYPWMRVLLAVGAGAGNVRGILYGFKEKVNSVILAPGAMVTAIGPNAAGVAPTQNPVQVSGWDATLVRRILTDASGRTIVAGSNGVGAAPTGNPLQVGMVNPATGFIQYMRGSDYGQWVHGPIGIGVAANANPVVVGGVGSGAAPGMVAPTTVCDLSAPITLAAAGATQIVAAPAGGRSIRVCHLSLSMQAPVDISLIYGTGAACAVAPANLTGAYTAALAMSLDFVNGPVTAAADNALCVNLGAAVAGGGTVTYASY
jgi:hypothetical protein